MHRNAAALTLLTFLAAGCGSAIEGADPAVAPAIERSKAENPEAWKRKVVLLGMDSCDPDLVDRFIREGKLPNFARMRREGTSGELLSLTPLLSPVVWTTISTGMSPERHGILDFVTETEDGIRPVSSRMRQADTVWELISSAHEAVGVVGWLVSFPAEPLNGFHVTERLGNLAYEGKNITTGDTPKSVYPESLLAELSDQRLTIDDMPLERVRAFVDVTEEEFGDSYTTSFEDDSNLLGGLRLIMADAETYRRVGTRLLREEQPRFFACYFNAMDALSHYFMPFAPPKMKHIEEDDYRKYKDVIEANYVWHDRVLGEFMDLADEDTTVIVVSDHGFKHDSLRWPESSKFMAKTGAAWHRRYGVVFAWGNGVKSGHRLRGASVYDIAPTVLAAMGYPVPDDMPGDPLADAFEDGLPHETVPTWFGERRRLSLAAETARIGDTMAAEVSASEREDLDKMAALGYIGGDRNDPATTILNAATRLIARNRIQAALESLEPLLDDPKHRRNPRVHMILAHTYVQQAEIKKARDAPQSELDEIAQKIEERCRDAIASGAEQFDALLLRARMHIVRNDLDSAEVFARQAVELKPHMDRAHSVHQKVLRERMDAAKDIRDAAIKRKDERAAEQAAIAVVRYRELAIEAARRALEREPRNSHLLNELAHLVLDPERGQTTDLRSAADEALDALDRALDLQPRGPRTHNNRAIALLRIGMDELAKRNTDTGRDYLEQALLSTETALESRADYSKGWANKAYTLWQLGRLDAAREAALEARKLNPSYVLHWRFMAAMEEAGKGLPPPAPQETSEVPSPPDHPARTPPEKG